MSDEYASITNLISYLKSSNSIIIVEGKKDIKSLEELGIVDNVHAIHKTNTSLDEKLIEITNDINDRSVVILTDLDRKGKDLYLLICESLSNMGFKVDETARDLLIKTRITHVEGLSTRYKKLGYNFGYK